jgi:hypothetical protein
MLLYLFAYLHEGKKLKTKPSLCDYLRMNWGDNLI